MTASTLAAFDGVNQPRPIVLLAFGGDQGVTATTYKIGVGPGIGTGSIGGTTWSDITTDVDAISIQGPALDEIEPASAGTCTFTVDDTSGAYDPENTAGPYTTGGGVVGEYEDIYEDLYEGPGGTGGASLVDLDVAVWVRAEYQGVFYDRFLGVVDAIIPDDAPPKPTVTFRCVDALAVLGRAPLAEVAATFDGDTTGERVDRILDAVGWPSSKRAVDAGRSLLGRTTLGASALALLGKVERTEMGYLYVDHHAGGLVTFRQRYATTTAARSTSVQATITDAGGMNALQRSRDRERLFNDVHATRDPAPSEPFVGGGVDPPQDDEPVEQVAVDQASVDRYGPLSYPGEAFPLARGDAEVLAGLQWLAPRFATPQVRITQVGVQGPGWDQWAELLALRLLDRIRVQRNTGAVAIDRELLLHQVSEDISRIERRWDFTLSTESLPAAEPTTVYRVGTGPGIGTASIGF